MNLSYLSYDVVKMILEIKYINWLRLKRCVCGGDDFKKCSAVECAECEDVYCERHPDSEDWLWECTYCQGIYCGEHTFKKDKYQKKVCLYCITAKNYAINKKCKAPKLRGEQVAILELYYERKNQQWSVDHPEEVTVFGL